MDDISNKSDDVYRRKHSQTRTSGFVEHRKLPVALPSFDDMFKTAAPGKENEVGGKTKYPSYVSPLPLVNQSEDGTCDTRRLHLNLPAPPISKSANNVPAPSTPVSSKIKILGDIVLTPRNKILGEIVLTPKNIAETLKKDVTPVKTTKNNITSPQKTNSESNVATHSTSTSSDAKLSEHRITPTNTVVTTETAPDKSKRDITPIKSTNNEVTSLQTGKSVSNSPVTPSTSTSSVAKHSQNVVTPANTALRTKTGPDKSKRDFTPIKLTNNEITSLQKSKSVSNRAATPSTSTSSPKNVITPECHARRTETDADKSIQVITSVNTPENKVVSPQKGKSVEETPVRGKCETSKNFLSWKKQLEKKFTESNADNNECVQQPVASTSTPRFPMKIKSAKKDGKNVNQKVDNTIKYIYNYIFKRPHLRNMLSSDEIKLMSQLMKLDDFHLHFCYCLFMDDRWWNIFQFCQQIQMSMSDEYVVEMYTKLEQEHFISTDYSKEATKILLNLLDIKQLKEICKDCFIIPKVYQRNNQKAQFIELLLAQDESNIEICEFINENNTKTDLRVHIYKKLGECAKLQPNLADTLRKMHLIYGFPNHDLKNAADVRQFVIAKNKNDIALPDCQIDSFSVFYTPAEFTSYAKAWFLRDKFVEILRKNDNNRVFVFCNAIFSRFCKAVEDSPSRQRPQHISYFCPGTIYASILSKGITQILSVCSEKSKEWLEYLLKQTRFCTYRRGHWYKLLFCLLHTMKRYEEAAKVIHNALNDENVSNVDKLKLLEDTHVKAISKKCTNQLLNNRIRIKSSEFRIVNSVSDDIPVITIDIEPPKGRNITETRTASILQSVAEHYEEIGYPRMFAAKESFLPTLLGLVVWDLIYRNTDTNCTFISEVQVLPLDLYFDFYKNRKSQIDERLELVDTMSKEEFKEFLRQVWDQYSHFKSLIHEDTFQNRDEMVEVLSVLSGSLVVKIVKRLVSNFRVYRNGFPNAIVWNCDNKVKFVHAYDKNLDITAEQVLWLCHLKEEADADVEKCCAEIGKRKYKRKQLDGKDVVEKKPKVERKKKSS